MCENTTPCRHVAAITHEGLVCTRCRQKLHEPKTASVRFEPARAGEGAADPCHRCAAGDCEGCPTRKAVCGPSLPDANSLGAP